MTSIFRSLAPLALVAACTSSDRPAERPDTVATPAAAPAPSATPACPSGADSLCYHAERTYDFAGDGHPFRIAVDARGPAPDSMRVALRIVRGDTVYHRADWNTVMYGRYDDRPAARDSAKRRTDAQLARLLADSAFRPTAQLLARGSNVDTSMSEAVGFDIAVAGERQRRHLAPGDTLPMQAAQSPQPVTDAARVRALVTELRDAPAFRYFTGGEATYTIAWSKQEQRFVVVFACC